jgi:hypothetical protein
MGFWAKSLLVFNCFYRDAKQSIRHVARQTGLSKSSIHRLKQAKSCKGKHICVSWVIAVSLFFVAITDSCIFILKQ